MNIYVGNVQYSTTEEHIRELFEQFGTVESVKMINDRETGRFRGFGFVEMSDEHGQKAIEELNGASFDKKVINVAVARPREDRAEGNRGGGGFDRNQRGRNNYNSNRY